MTIQLLHGDCLEVMRGMADNAVDCVVTDPPYGLEFMSKGWDHGVPGEPYWTEALRVAKPGAMLLAFGGTRTQHRLVCAIEDAGWEIRDCILWCYGQGFPKSHQFSKSMNGHGATWKEYGTALKPAVEMITLAMKPLDGTFAHNALSWGVAGINVDGCRIGVDDDEPNKRTNLAANQARNNFGGGADRREPRQHGSPTGRWPSNLILDEDAGAALDAQSGVSKSTGGIRSGERFSGGWAREAHNDYEPGAGAGGYGDSGGASRFFYCAKASRAEREAGLEGLPLKPGGFLEGNADTDNARKIGARPDIPPAKVRNNHPTVKPLALMRYLVRLVRPPSGGVVLDPFVGSGTTMLACVYEGCDGIGIDSAAEYIDIARRRTDYAQLQPRMELAA